jgi:N-acetylmuramoyl-L-alanine amidase
MGSICAIMTKAVQRFLNEAGYSHPSIPKLTEDGVYGPKTEMAVREFQRLFGLKEDGLAGAVTLCSLIGFSECGKPTPYIPSMWTIVVDAGHGGHDPGAVSGDRIEKIDNLMFAELVADKLRERGQNVIMTRTGDTYVPLAKRSETANQNNADLFISFHRNYSENPEGNGIEVYVMKDGDMLNIALAQTVLSELLKENIQSNGGLRQADLSVLRETNAPAMLFEMGYTTNAIDNELFLHYIDAYANAIARGIVMALGSGGDMIHDIYVVQPGDTLWQIAQWFHSTVNEIREINHMTSDTIFDGQILKIPSEGAM